MDKKYRNALTADRARALFSYDENSGLLLWSVDRRKVKAGQEAGCIYKGRTIMYRQVCVDYVLYRVHRIIWLIMTGSWPNEEIDHIDGDGLNNRWQNLRSVDREGNSHNMALPTTNTSGCVGVCWHSRAGKWRARIYKNNCEVNLGLFNTKDAAIRARKSAEISLDYHENHGRHRALPEATA